MICPNCGHAIEAPAAHRGELERQLGSAALAESLMRSAKLAPGDAAVPLEAGGRRFVAWRGLVWATCRLRKPAKCAVTGADLAPGEHAWRQLSEVKGREVRVSAAAWSGI